MLDVKLGLAVDDGLRFQGQLLCCLGQFFRHVDRVYCVGVSDELGNKTNGRRDMREGL